MDKTITVILADDHRAILNSINALLNQLPHINVVATAENGEKAVALAQTNHPDVIILDVDMPRLNGLQATSRLRSLMPGIKIIIFSINDEPWIVRAAFKQGADAYVLKSHAASDLVAAIEKLVAGERFLSAPVASYIQ